MPDEPITETPQETALAAAPSTALNYMDSTALNKAYKSATIFAQSDLVPDTYRNKPQNVMIAMDLASRMGISMMQVMQNLYIVKGHPAWSGQYCISAINGCGKFSPLKFIWADDNGGSCTAKATRLADSEVCYSEAISMQMAKNEGWLDKNGSKWKTMPRQMMMYRAASFFARVYCPDVLMGMQTVEEVKDVNGYDKEEKEYITVSLED